MYDAVIVSGRPAADLILERVHRTVLLIDTGPGRDAPTDNVRDFGPSHRFAQARG
ncbi:hypothetical protein ACIBP6_06340 [Nonomuraea terrae]|uniref:hypothetical protein n=1 Tax=Nonomuraea terrae TaxID=2530383 RepID=UPI0037921E98